jgi:hypothetical protein
MQSPGRQRAEEELLAVVGADSDCSFGSDDVNALVSQLDTTVSPKSFTERQQHGSEDDSASVASSADSRLMEVLRSPATSPRSPARAAPAAPGEDSPRSSRSSQADLSLDDEVDREVAMSTIVERGTPPRVASPMNSRSSSLRPLHSPIHSPLAGTPFPAAVRLASAAVQSSPDSAASADSFDDEGSAHSAATTASPVTAAVAAAVAASRAVPQQRQSRIPAPARTQAAVPAAAVAATVAVVTAPAPAAAAPTAAAVQHHRSRTPPPQPDFTETETVAAAAAAAASDFSYRPQEALNESLAEHGFAAVSLQDPLGMADTMADVLHQYTQRGRMIQDLALQQRRAAAAAAGSDAAQGSSSRHEELLRLLAAAGRFAKFDD